EQLDRSAEHRVGELAGRRQWLKLVAEVRTEEVVDDGEDLRARAVVHRQRQHAFAGLLTPLAKDLNVGMAEPVDRLELVAYEEPLVVARTAGDHVDKLALQPVGVLELVDHDRPEAELLALADRLVVTEQIARAEL